jgi:hypothetical protein
MKHEESAFPIQKSQTDEATGNKFTSEVVGGLSRRAYFFVEFHAALLSNPAYIHQSGMTSRVLREVAMKEATECDLMLTAAESER